MFKQISISEAYECPVCKNIGLEVYSEKDFGESCSDIYKVRCPVCNATGYNNTVYLAYRDMICERYNFVIASALVELADVIENYECEESGGKVFKVVINNDNAD